MTWTKRINGSQPAGSGACLENRWRRGPLVGSSPTASAWPRYANGRALGLNGACGFDCHTGTGSWNKCLRLGRQWADHSRRPRDAEVRVPPEPSFTPSLSSPECCHSVTVETRVQIRRGRERKDGTVRKPASDRPNPDSMGSLPRATPGGLLGWCSQAACKPLP